MCLARVRALSADQRPTTAASARAGSSDRSRSSGSLAAACRRSLWSLVSGEELDVLETAVRQAMARMESKDVLLLSPGCASWVQFDNYEQRGDAFCRLVHEALSDSPQRHREHRGRTEERPNQIKHTS